MDQRPGRQFPGRVFATTAHREPEPRPSDPTPKTSAAERSRPQTGAIPKLTLPPLDFGPPLTGLFPWLPVPDSPEDRVPSTPAQGSEPDRLPGTPSPDPDPEHAHRPSTPSPDPAPGRRRGTPSPSPEPAPVPAPAVRHVKWAPCRRPRSPPSEESAVSDAQAKAPRSSSPFPARDRVGGCRCRMHKLMCWVHQRGERCPLLRKRETRS